MTSLRRLTPAFALLVAAVSLHGQAISIGDHKQLFIDDKFVAGSSGVEWVMNPPVKHGAVLKGDKSWDKYQLSSYGTVMEDQGKFRLLYGARLPAPDGQDRIRGEIMYAESTDGICWDKPNLGICEWQGSKANNILMEGTLESAGVFIDPKAASGQRYKILGRLHEASARWPNGNAPAGSGLYMYTSPDGLRWTLHPERVLPFDPDTLNVPLYDERTGKYLAYVRTWKPLRRVGVVEMDDMMRPWPYTHGLPPRLWPDRPTQVPAPSREVPEAFGPEADDPPNVDFYTSAVVRYPWADDAYFMFPSAYRHFPEPPGARTNDGTLDIQLAVSRDGRKFHRVARSPYIRLGLRSERDNSSMYMYIGLLRRNNVLYQYYEGNDFTHGSDDNFGGEKHSSVFLVTQRLDGLVALAAGPAGGSFVTPPLLFHGRRLLLNLDASATGEVEVELQTPEGRPIGVYDYDSDLGVPRGGFTFAEADPLYFNDTARAVTWRRGDRDVSPFSGKPVRLAFRLRSAKLYSFQFTP